MGVLERAESLAFHDGYHWRFAIVQTDLVGAFELTGVAWPGRVDVGYERGRAEGDGGEVLERFGTGGVLGLGKAFRFRGR
jgi:hypothetical protein